MGQITVKWLQDYLMAARDESSCEVQKDVAFPRTERIVCDDGFSLSVQASHGHYCQPRHNIAEWYEVEVGYPSDTPRAFLYRAEDSDRPTDTVYPYVPIDLVVEEINNHGGVA